MHGDSAHKRLARALTSEADRRADTRQRRGTERGKDSGRHAVDNLHRNLLRQLVADEHRRHVRDKHTERGADDDEQRRGVVRSQRDRRDLCLVAHLGEEERDERRTEDAESRSHPRLSRLDLVGDERPDRHADERQAEDPAQDLRA